MLNDTHLQRAGRRPHLERLGIIELRKMVGLSRRSSDGRLSTSDFSARTMLQNSESVSIVA